ncbi:hypothetical protein KAR91_14045 [Candidatus Pacearchaeota archaeon]|nr:hypothetical protein [Candidatus Pacearchaeota archaeon]
MIPAYSQSGVLPPFLPGSTPVAEGSMSPYKVSLTDIISAYCTSKERFEILNGLISYRKALREIGIQQGFQWINGSFVEDTAKTIGRMPSDIDIVTFSFLSFEGMDAEEFIEFIESKADIFDPDESKKKYFCDAYFVDMNAHPSFLVHHTKYWFGLFSHQRDTFVWKGMLEIPLTDNDDNAISLLEECEYAS